MAAYGAELIRCIEAPSTPGRLYTAVQPDPYLTPTPSWHPNISLEETKLLLTTWQSSKPNRDKRRLAQSMTFPALLRFFLTACLRTCLRVCVRACMFHVFLNFERTTSI